MNVTIRIVCNATAFQGNESGEVQKILTQAVKILQPYNDRLPSDSVFTLRDTNGNPVGTLRTGLRLTPAKG